MADLRITITDTLKKLGPSAPRVLHDKIGGDAGAFKGALKAMLASGEIKGQGATTRRLIALPDQKFADAQAAPPQRRKKAPAKKKRAYRKRKHPKTAHRKQRARATETPAASIAPGFLVAITSRREIVLFDGTGPARVYDRERSIEIANLVLDNFEPD